MESRRQRVDKSKAFTSAKIIAAIRIFRPLFDSLRKENPHWSHAETIRYLYENSDDYKRLYDLQPSFARMICDQRKSVEDLENFAALFWNREQGILNDQQVADRLASGLR